MKHLNLIVVIFSYIIIYGILSAGEVQSAEISCPPQLKMISSSPKHMSEGALPDSPITITWDKKTLEIFSEGLRDLKPVLESVNIEGGRYGMGTLLTTEWGIGGSVSWDDNIEIITPEAPLETGTQYRLWTYLYMTLRDGAPQSCARVGGEVVFKTAGPPPDDGNPVRKVDLSKIYHGDKYGHGDIHGKVTALNTPLGILTLDDDKMGVVSVIIYQGIPVLSKGNFIAFEKIRIGDRIEARFTGGRIVTVEVTQ